MNVNVNVNLYSASSQEAPLMRYCVASGGSKAEAATRRLSYWASLVLNFSVTDFSVKKRTMLYFSCKFMVPVFCNTGFWRRLLVRVPWV